MSKLAEIEARTLAGLGTLICLIAGGADVALLAMAVIQNEVGHAIFYLAIFVGLMVAERILFSWPRPSNVVSIDERRRMDAAARLGSRSQF